MYASATGGTQNALASVDVPHDGKLVGCFISGNADLDADGEIAEIEISFGSTSGFTSNDTRSRIAIATVGRLAVAAAGQSIGQLAVMVDLPDLRVGMGERIYIHSLGSAGVAADYWVSLHFDFELDRAAIRRR
jgi:hypothetical protein